MLKEAGNPINILLVVTGGIAAYKALLLTRLLRQAGYIVTPVMTKAAHEFITPLSLAALAEQPVRDTLFDLENETKIGHIELARSADLVVVAPASADFLAKMTHGFADDLASTLLLANIAPVMIAPAMNVAMWHAPPTQNNIASLSDRGVAIVGPDEGSMACGEFGPGRMAEPEIILAAINTHFRAKPLAGRHVIVTSGPTHEAIDPVRYIANRSSGKQGTAIAHALMAAGASVTFVTGPADAARPKGAKVIEIESARDMLDAVERALPADIAIFAAAVADWHVANASGLKIKKSKGGMTELQFAENPDILKTIAQRGDERPRLVIGFAAETNDVLENARAKHKRKGCDWLIANDVSGDVMGGDNNTAHLLRAGGDTAFPTLSKTKLAEAIVAEIIAEVTAW